MFLITISKKKKKLQTSPNVETTKDGQIYFKIIILILFLHLNESLNLYKIITNEANTKNKIKKKLTVTKNKHKKYFFLTFCPSYL